MNWLKYEIELIGIVNSVKDVCNDAYMLGYTEYLAKAIKNRDVKLVNIISIKMLEWYNKNYQRLLDDDFVYNKENQTRTKLILEGLYKDTLSLAK